MYYNMPGIQGNPVHAHEAILVHDFAPPERGIRTTVRVISLGESVPHILLCHVWMRQHIAKLLRYGVGDILTHAVL